MSICIESRCAPGGTDQQLTAFETKEAVMGSFLHYSFDECPDRRERQWWDHFQVGGLTVCGV